MTTVGSTTSSSQLDAIKQSTNPAKSSLTSKTESGDDATSLASDFDTFMKLLTTQLKNQDPINPTDTNEFTSQLVAFSGVEQQIKTNKHLEELLEMNKGGSLDNSVGYIGAAVDAKGDSGYLQNERATFAYTLDRAATDVTVSITDEAGRVVYSGNGSKLAGKNYVTWDGSNSFTSAKARDGVYHIKVVAKDINGKAVTATTHTTGTVLGAELDKDGKVVLNVSNVKVPIDDITSVRQPTTQVASN